VIYVILFLFSRYKFIVSFRFIFFILFFSSNVFSQDILVEWKNKSNSDVNIDNPTLEIKRILKSENIERKLDEVCDSYYDDENESFSEEQANKILDIILSTIGASKRFVLKACKNTSNAFATTKNGIRYIIYDKEFMEEINSNTNYWFNMWVLAHEVGHHINGHVLAPDLSIEDRRWEELEADKFAGFVLAELGATLSQASLPLDKLNHPEEDNLKSRYPSKYKRLDAIKQGFNNAIGVPTFYKKTVFNSAEEYFYSGYEKSIYKDYYGAISDYTKAIELNPTYAMAYYNRGVIKNELKDYERSIKDYNSAIALNPNYYMAYYNRGLIKDNLGDQSGAFDDYTKAIEIYPEDPIAFYNRGIIYKNKEQYYKAISDYTDAIQLNPNYAEAYLNRGTVKNILKNYNGAIEDYSKSINLNPNIIAFNNRGISKNNVEDYYGAILDYNKAIEMDSSYADAYANRGVSKYYIENKKGACDDWSKAIELGFDNAKQWIVDQCN